MVTFVATEPDFRSRRRACPMAQTLYRKYRPQTFADIIGQNHVKVTLLSELATGRVAHAYLFTGPRGVGKTTIARLLAKAVNCLHPAVDGAPDNTCEACVDIREGRSLDLIEIDAASHTGVENVRTQIIENARFTPSRWKMKVFIIDEVHMLSTSAFNALLKTLEEPPDHVLFILATTEAHKVPETIISRCQRFDFRRLRHEDLVQRLQGLAGQEHVTVADDVLDAIARYARGSFRDAESLLGQVLTLGEKDITREQADLVLPRSNQERALDVFDAVLRRDATQALTIVNELVRDAVDVQQFTAELVEIARKALLVKVSNQLAMFSALELAKEQEVRLLGMIEKASVDNLTLIIRTLLDRDISVDEQDLPQLPLELAILRLTIIDNPLSALPSSTVSSAGVDHPVPAPTSKTKPIDDPTGAAKKKTATTSSALTTLETVRQRWPEVMSLVQAKNHSLRLVCTVAQPLQLDGTTLTLGVRFAFHRERIELPKNRAVIEEALRDAFGQQVTVKAIVSELAPAATNYEKEANVEMVEESSSHTLAAASSSQQHASSDSTWDALIKTFGGKTI